MPMFIKGPEFEDPRAAGLWAAQAQHAYDLEYPRLRGPGAAGPADQQPPGPVFSAEVEQVLARQDAKFPLGKDDRRRVLQALQELGFVARRGQTRGGGESAKTYFRLLCGPQSTNFGWFHSNGIRLSPKAQAVPSFAGLLASGVVTKEGRNGGEATLPGIDHSSFAEVMTLAKEFAVAHG